MGFQSRRLLRDSDNRCEAIMIYPSEADIEGSEAAFAALWRVLIEKECVAIVRYVRADGAEPAFMALFPEREQLGEDGGQAMPPCLFGVTLPYQDELRSIPAEAVDVVAAGAVRARAPLLRAAAAVVDAMSGPAYDVLDPATQLSNPQLQSFYGALETLALGLPPHETADSRMDQSLPAAAASALAAPPAVLAEALGAFAQAAALPPAREGGKVGGGKRRAGGGAGGSGSGGGGGGGEEEGEEGSARPAKKSRVSALTEEEWRELAEQGKLSTKTVDDLKSGLALCSLKLGGKKEELIERLTAHLLK